VRSEVRYTQSIAPSSCNSLGQISLAALQKSWPPTRKDAVRSADRALVSSSPIDLYWLPVVKAVNPERDALALAGRPEEANAAYQAARHGYCAARSPTRHRHHFAHLCLEVTADLDQALALAAQDYAERPNRDAGELLAAVLTARGEDRQARLLTARIRAETGAAVTELRDARILDCLSRS